MAPLILIDRRIAAASRPYPLRIAALSHRFEKVQEIVAGEIEAASLDEVVLTHEESAAKRLDGYARGRAPAPSNVIAKPNCPAAMCKSRTANRTMTAVHARAEIAGGCLAQECPDRRFSQHVLHAFPQLRPERLASFGPRLRPRVNPAQERGRCQERRHRVENNRERGGECPMRKPARPGHAVVITDELTDSFAVASDSRPVATSSGSTAELAAWKKTVSTPASSTTARSCQYDSSPYTGNSPTAAGWPAGSRRPRPDRLRCRPYTADR
jgi:hypothetical protein